MRLMKTLIALLMMASAATASSLPQQEKDIESFLRLVWAKEHCPGITIKKDATIQQVVDLGLGLKWTPERIQDKVDVENRIAEFKHWEDPVKFCDSARQLFRSYDPAYLQRVGVTD
jgi:hypothetical protein